MELTACEPFDLAVVGGGIVGLNVAYLAGTRRPDWRILLVDRSLFGHGATAYSAGLATRISRSPRERDLSVRSERLYAQLCERLRLPVYRVPLLFVVSEAKRPELEKCLRGSPLADSERAAVLASRCGGLSTADGEAILDGGDATYAEASSVLAALVAHLRVGNRVTCWEGVEILSVGRCEEGLALRAADGRSIAARRVVDATGPWILSGPGREIAAREGVRLKKIVSLHVDRRPAPGSPVIYFYDHGAFLLPYQRPPFWLLSITSVEWDCRPEASELRVSAEDRAMGLGLLESYVPEWAGECHGGRVFCDAYTPDRVPFVAPAAGLPGFIVAGAGCGSGFRFAPGLAAAALDALAEVLP